MINNTNLLVIVFTIVLVILGISLIYLFTHSLKQKRKLIDCINKK